jgi:hypothetical protein
MGYYQFKKTLLILSILVYWSSTLSGQVLYISPDGSDKNAGTKDYPFATIEKAQKAIRDIRNKKSGADITVLIRGGNYFLEKTIVFGINDGAEKDARTSYEAYPGESPCFSGAIKLENWQKLVNDTVGFPANSKGKIWFSKIPQKYIGQKFYTLYNHSGLMRRARSDGFLPTNADSSIIGRNSIVQRTLHFPEGKLKNWKFLNDVEIVSRTSAAWALNILSLASVDEKKGIALTNETATYTLSRCGYQPFLTETVWVENCPEYLDEPGEWVSDNKNGIIYYWPLDDKPEMDIELPILIEFIRVEGAINYNGPIDLPVKSLKFKGLTFTHGQRYKRDNDRVGWGLQHDWDLFDYPNAIIRFRGAENCTIDNCHFYNTGSNAIRLDLYCQNNWLINNTIEYTGSSGIILAGYGPGTKDVNKNNSIINNSIHHTGQIYWASAGLFIWQSGNNMVSNNLIHHTPYAGILCTGRIMWQPNPMETECKKTIRLPEIPDFANIQKNYSETNRASWDAREKYIHGRNNTIQFNELHHTMMKLNDGNDIYISGAGRNNKVSNNYIHDSFTLGNDASIRCDNDQYTTTIEKNIIYHTRGSGVCIKGTNTISNNIFIDILPAGHTRGYVSIEEPEIEGTIIKHNIFYSRTQGQTAIFIANWHHPLADISTCMIDSNLYYCPPDKKWGTNHIESMRSLKLEMHSISDDPLFFDINNSLFQINKKSPAYQIGYKDIDIQNIGLLPIPYKKNK